jgi:heat shock protein HslJ
MNATSAPEPLVGVLWRVERVVSPSGPVVAPPDSKASLHFDPSGRVLVHTGCNTGSGPVTFGPHHHLTIGPVALTRRMGPPHLVELERTIIAMLQLPMAWSIDDGCLTLAALGEFETGLHLHASLDTP